MPETKVYDLRGSLCIHPKTEHNEATFVDTKGFYLEGK